MAGKSNGPERFRPATVDQLERFRLAFVVDDDSWPALGVAQVDFVGSERQAQDPNEGAATPGNGPGTGQAVVSTYDLEYPIAPGWTEKVLPGCFADSIAAHPAIPIFYNHDWGSGPIGTGHPTEQGNQLLVDFELYLGQGDLVGRVYKAMQNNALEEWSIGFWATAITTDSKTPNCDQIAEGDLAEASVCVRGANPETGTLLLAGKRGWLMGSESERKREVELVKRATRQLVGSPALTAAIRPGSTYDHRSQLPKGLGLALQEWSDEEGRARGQRPALCLVWLPRQRRRRTRLAPRSCHAGAARLQTTPPTWWPCVDRATDASTPAGLRPCSRR